MTRYDTRLTEDERNAVHSLDNHRKAQLTVGANFWSTAEVTSEDGSFHIPSITLVDGPNGTRKQTASFDHMGISPSLPATCFPSACLSACTFEPALIEMEGQTIGEECIAQDVAVLLGPGINIKRHPLGGRNFEYFSEDPLLSGKMGAAFVRGLQSTGTTACVKHMAANSQEIRRMTADSVVDTATLNEIYLRSFEIVVREAHPGAIMPAYNRLNGPLCSENPVLLNKARDEWGFNGAFISDWGGMDKSIESVEAGLDLCMPGPRPDHIRAVSREAENNQLTAEALDRAAERVAGLALQHQRTKAAANNAGDVDYASHLAVAQLIAEAGCVLLQNNGILPLDATKVSGAKTADETRCTDGASSSTTTHPLAIIGAFADQMRYQGSGSSKVNPILVDSLLEAFDEMGIAYEYAPGYDLQTGETTDELLAEAVALAQRCDTVMAVIGLPDMYESEGYDRHDLALPDGMNQLMDQLIDANPRTAAVLLGGGVMELPWREGAAAILAGYLPGCRGGHALANILTGAVNPSGKLAESWPIALGDTALGDGFPVRQAEIYYIEGPFVGYRYYQAAQVDVAYPFGHGLSYTHYEYSDLSIRPEGQGYRVEFDLTNTGSYNGFEVVQIYVAPTDATIPRPHASLVAFRRVFVPAGSSVHVQMSLGADAFWYWDVREHARHVDAGAYEVRISASSADVRLRTTLQLDANAPFAVREPQAFDEVQRERLEPYFEVKPHGFTQDAFKALYHIPLPEPIPIRPFTPNSRLGDMRVTPVGRVLLSVIEKIGRKEAEDDPGAKRMVEQTFEDLPIRSLVLGKVPYEVVTAFAGMLNGHPGDAVRAILGILFYDPDR